MFLSVDSFSSMIPGGLSREKGRMIGMKDYFQILVKNGRIKWLRGLAGGQSWGAWGFLIRVARGWLPRGNTRDYTFLIHAIRLKSL